MDGESRQLLVDPVMNTSLYWLRQARPSGEVWPKGFDRHEPPQTASLYREWSSEVVIVLDAEERHREQARLRAFAR